MNSSGSTDATIIHPARFQQAFRRRVVEQQLENAISALHAWQTGTITTDDVVFIAHRDLNLALTELCQHGGLS